MVDLSIIICTRDRANSLDGTLRSIAAIRSERSWEAIILDNGSTDDTAAVIRAADDCGGRLRYAFEPQPGLGAARDTAWRLAQGRICAFSDDDCYLDPGYVDAVCAAFDDYPDAGCIGGRILLHDPDDAPITIDERTEPFEYPAQRFFSIGGLQGANMAFRTEVLREIGGFDRAMGAGTVFPSEDIDVIAGSIWAGHPARFDPRPVVRHHHGRRGASAIKAIEGYDRGRGSYLAKYSLRPDTRLVYLKHWLTQPWYNPFSTRDGVEREIATARAYLKHRGARGFAFLMEGFFAALRLSAALAVWHRGKPR